MKNLFLDIETYSENPIKNGVRKYVDTDSFRILLLSYAVDDGDVILIDLTKEKLPQEVRAMLTDAGYCKRAFNANFEMTCIGHVWPELIVETQWSCDQALATYNSLPPSLAGVGVALHLPRDKQKDARGKALIRYFCLPCKPTKTNGGRTRNLPEHAPDKWAEFCEYNRQDVVTERAIFGALKDNQPPESEHALWLLDRAINERGIGIDLGLAKNAIEMSEILTNRGMARLTELTGLENPNSVAKLRERLKFLGCPMPSLSRDVVLEKLKDPALDDAAREVLRLRLALGKSSVKKYQAMIDTVTHDGRAHNLFQFYGASHTGRWAGRNIQLQNLPRNYISDLDEARELVKAGDLELLEMLYDNPMGIISQLIRTALVPSDGNRFIVADFSAIEARVIAWVSGERWRQEAFANGKDIYCESASQMFHCTVVKHGENGHLRQKGKIAELALGYGGGVGALQAMDTSHSIEENEMQDIVDRWREASPRIPMLWRQLENAAKACIERYQRTGKGIRTKNLTAISGVSFEMTDAGNLLLHLPSGRSLSYREAHIGENRFGGESIVYLGANQVTRDWDDVETYGGKLTENCLAEGTLVLTEYGLVRIELIDADTKIWDGEEFVSHNGLIEKGKQPVVSVDGLLMTKDHKILTKKGWVKASESSGLDWSDVPLPDRYRSCGFGEWESQVALQVRLRETGSRHGARPDAQGTLDEIVRVHEGETDSILSSYARHDESSGVRSVALHDSALHGTDAQGVEKLRRQGNHSLREMASQLPELLDGHESDVSQRIGHRQDRQQQGVFPGKLPLDNSQEELPQQTLERPHRHAAWQNDDCRVFGKDRNRKDNNLLSSSAPLADGIVVYDAGLQKRVYDIRNCGPRHQFAVYDPVMKTVRMVHNCVQAIARDCLAEAMTRLEAAGYHIVAHIHDEVVLDVPNTSQYTLADAIRIMTQNEPWNEGLIMNADGFEGEYYKKD